MVTKSMKKRLSLTTIALCLLLSGMAWQPAQAAGRMTRIVMGCRNFLVTGSTFVIRPTSQFTVEATDSQNNIVYKRIGNMPKGTYAGFSGLFGSQPVEGPVRVIIRLN